MAGILYKGKGLKLVYQTIYINSEDHDGSYTLIDGHTEFGEYVELYKTHNGYLADLPGIRSTIKCVLIKNFAITKLLDLLFGN